jgi:hypothetical protein
MTEVGQWAEPFLDERGRPQPGLTVTFYEDDGTTPATLYTSQAGDTLLSNPIPVGVAQGAAGIDTSANVIAYAVPGEYVVAASRGATEVYRGPVAFAVDQPTVDLAVGPAEMVGRLATDAEITAVSLTDLKSALNALP